RLFVAWRRGWHARLWQGIRCKKARDHPGLFHSDERNQEHATIDQFHQPLGAPFANSGWGFYLPAAFRSASLIRSCQPGPPSWKCSSTSWSMRNETNSFTPGSAVGFGGASTTLVVVRLNAASASVRASFRVRGRL